jgi:hypothetical protein
MRNPIEYLQHLFMTEFGIGRGDAADIAAKIKDDLEAARRRAEPAPHKHATRKKRKAGRARPH